MGRSSPKLREARKELMTQAGYSVGEIADIDAAGRAYVRFGEAAATPVLARSVLDARGPLGEDTQALVGTAVLLAFENGDLSLPIIVGLIREIFRPSAELPEVKLDLGKNRDVLVDGRRLVLEADHEILLRCGKSTILLQRDGKVLIRGANLVSRSTGPNKIKGGSISLN